MPDSRHRVRGDQPTIRLCSHVRANCQSISTVRWLTASASATSGISIPPKQRSSTTFALRACSSPSNSRSFVEADDLIDRQPIGCQAGGQADAPTATPLLPELVPRPVRDDSSHGDGCDLVKVLAVLPRRGPLPDESPVGLGDDCGWLPLTSVPAPGEQLDCAGVERVEDEGVEQFDGVAVTALYHRQEAGYLVVRSRRNRQLRNSSVCWSEAGWPDPGWPDAARRSHYETGSGAGRGRCSR